MKRFPAQIHAIPQKFSRWFFMSFCTGLLLPFGSCAQDLHFTGLQAYLIELNPAFAGYPLTQWRGGIIYRLQNRVFPVPYRTAYAYFSTLMLQDALEPHWAGAGFQIVVDYATPRLRWYQLRLVPAYFHAFSSQFYLGVAISPILYIRQLDPEGLLFPDQLTPDGPDPTRSHGESRLRSLITQTGWSLSAGLLAGFPMGRHPLVIGLAFQHPRIKDRFMEGSSVRGPRWTLYATGNFYPFLTASPVLKPIVFTTYDRNVYYVSFGLLALHKMTFGDFTSYIGGGILARTFRSLSPLFLIQYSSFSFYATYDFFLGKQRTTALTPWGGLEVGIEIRFPPPEAFQLKRSISCPRL